MEWVGISISLGLVIVDFGKMWIGLKIIFWIISGSVCMVSDNFWVVLGALGRFQVIYCFSSYPSKNTTITF